MENGADPKTGSLSVRRMSAGLSVTRSRVMLAVQGVCSREGGRMMVMVERGVEASSWIKWDADVRSDCKFCIIITQCLKINQSKQFTMNK